MSFSRAAPSASANGTWGVRITWATAVVSRNASRKPTKEDTPVPVAASGRRPIACPSSNGWATAKPAATTAVSTATSTRPGASRTA